MITHKLLIADKQKKPSFYKDDDIYNYNAGIRHGKVVYLLWCYVCSVSVIYIAAVISVQCFCISIKTMTKVMDTTY